jgi:hypothetical protein
MDLKRLIRIMSAVLVFTGVVSGPVYADPALEKLVAEGKFKEAIDYAEEKIPTSQRDAAAWVLIGRANEGLDMPEKALACYLVGWRMNADD